MTIKTILRWLYAKKKRYYLIVRRTYGRKWYYTGKTWSTNIENAKKYKKDPGDLGIEWLSPQQHRIEIHYPYYLTDSPRQGAVKKNR